MALPLNARHPYPTHFQVTLQMLTPEGTLHHGLLDLNIDDEGIKSNRKATSHSDFVGSLAPWAT
jgi:hypothetical protein